MSADVSGNSSVPPDQGALSGQVDNPSGPGAPGAAGSSGSGGGGELSGTTIVKDLESFKEIAPEVHKKMMEGIAADIVNRMKAHQERLKKLMRDAQSKG